MVCVESVRRFGVADRQPGIGIEMVSLRSGSHDLDLLAVGPDIIEPQLGALITNSVDSSSKCDLSISLVLLKGANSLQA